MPVEKVVSDRWTYLVLACLAAGWFLGFAALFGFLAATCRSGRRAACSSSCPATAWSSGGTAAWRFRFASTSCNNWYKFSNKFRFFDLSQSMNFWIHWILLFGSGSGLAIGSGSATGSGSGSAIGSGNAYEKAWNWGNRTNDSVILSSICKLRFSNLRPKRRRQRKPKWISFWLIVVGCFWNCNNYSWNVESWLIPLGKIFRLFILISPSSKYKQIDSQLNSIFFIFQWGQL